MLVGKKFIQGLIAVMLTGGWVISADAAMVNVVGVGTTYEEAILDGCRNGVEKQKGLILRCQTSGEMGSVRSDHVISVVDTTYIQNIRVIKSEEKNDLYTVVLNMDVVSELNQEQYSKFTKELLLRTILNNSLIHVCVDCEDNISAQATARGIVQALFTKGIKAVAGKRVQQTGYDLRACLRIVENVNIAKIFSNVQNIKSAMAVLNFDLSSSNQQFSSKDLFCPGAGLNLDTAKSQAINNISVEVAGEIERILLEKASSLDFNF